MDLRENPFKVLEASVEDNRRRIIELSEERAFELDAETCSQTRSILTNPQKRVRAEVTWPLDMCDNEIEEVFAYIEDLENGDSTEEYDFSEYSSLTQLLIKLSGVKYQTISDVYQAKHFVLSLSRLFDDVNSEDVLEDINLNRGYSGFPKLEKLDEVEESLLFLRNEIRHSISEKLRVFSEKQYLSIITMLAESYGLKYRGQVVIEDVIEDYKLAMSSRIEDGKAEILELVDFTLKGIDQVRLDDVIGVIAEKVREWDKLVQPIQLISQERGEEESDSADVANALRHLGIILFNDYNETELASSVTDLLKECFAELPVFFEKVNDDSDKLEQIISDRQRDKEISGICTKLDTIKDRCKSLEHYSDMATVRDFNALIHDANFTIKNSSLDQIDIEKLRVALFNLARDTAIMLHNEKGKTSLAVEIMQLLASDFSDISTISKIINKDINQLKSVLININQHQNTYKSIPNRSNTNSSGDDASTSIGCAIVLVIFVAIVLGVFGYLIDKESSNPPSNKPSTSTKPAVSSYSYDEEVLFSQSCSLGTKVYANITSIFPTYGIYRDNNATPYALCCECKSSSGSTVWVYMSVSDYNTYIDSSANFNVSNGIYNEITFSTTKKVHGTVAKSGAFAVGLEEKTTTYIIRFSSIN